MTPDIFFTPLLGQSLLYPGQSEIYHGQCVQSVLLWLKATGTSPPIYPSAADYFTNGITGYTKIAAGKPILTGDIVVWGKNFPPSGGNGHIDVASANGSLSSFSAYDSNWIPLKLAHILHTGNNNNYIAGYLRKGNDMPITSDQLDKLLKMGLRREPTASELNNPDFHTNPGLAIDTCWNVAGNELYSNPPENAQYAPYTGAPLFTKKG